MEKKRVIIRCMIWMLAWVLLVESQANARPLSFDVRGNNEYEFIKLPDTLKQNEGGRLSTEVDERVVQDDLRESPKN